tara:strand:+ start:114898 stop:115545 length:648 start_codon:yes stop_codon:yes gene_type:complete
MQTGFSFLDVIFLIVMAIFIATRFFGHKLPKDDKKLNKKNVVKFPNSEISEVVKEQVKPKHKKVDLSKLSGLEQIKATDKSFKEKDFIAGATNAYQMYYDALNERDEKTLENMLAPRKFDEIMESIESLEEEGKQRFVDIDTFKNVEIIDARLHGRTAIIEVKYIVMQKDFIEDLDTKKSPKSLKNKEVSTVWTWARSVESDDLNWELESIALLS